MADLDSRVNIDWESRDGCADAEGHILTEISVINDTFAIPAPISASIRLDCLEDAAINKQEASPGSKYPMDTIMPGIVYRNDVKFARRSHICIFGQRPIHVRSWDFLALLEYVIQRAHDRSLNRVG